MSGIDSALVILASDKLFNRCIVDASSCSLTTSEMKT